MEGTELDQIRGELEAILRSRERCDWRSDAAMDERYRELCAKERELLLT